MLVFLTKTVNQVDESGSTLSAEKRKVQRGQMLPVHCLNTSFKKKSILAL